MSGGSFPVPHIDKLVDTTAVHHLMSFMDALTSYNQILMHLEDQKKTPSAKLLLKDQIMWFHIKKDKD